MAALPPLFAKDAPAVSQVQDGQMVIVENTNELLIRVRDKLKKVVDLTDL